MAKAIPEGMTAVTPYLTVEGADTLIRFLEQAFGAKLESRHEVNGRVMHAQVRIDGACIMMGEATDEWKQRPGQIYLAMPDVDDAYRRAMEAGAVKSLREPTTEFYGDRVAGVEDMCGNWWWISTHVEDVPPEEMERRMQEYRK